ncbi:MAG: hypothetical protein ACN0LA_10035 [Candidatus Longimicrobiales bacterium M2_2A_002]
MKRLLLFIFALAVAAAPARAQQDLLNACSPDNLTIVASPPVPGGVPSDVENQFSFLCGQVASTLSNVQPSVGIAFSGGAHTLGSYSTIGRRLGLLPRISVTARVNGAFADVPDILGGAFDPAVTDGGTVAGMPTTGIPVLSVQGDVVVGLFNGFSFGPALGGLGAIDLLGSVSFIPSIQDVEDAIGLDETIFNYGIGARVGILQQGLVVPGVAISAMYRNMGDVTFGDMDNPAPAAFASDLSVISLRAGISKGFAMLDLAAGAGYDIYTSDTRLNWNLTYECPASRCGTAQTVQLRPESPLAGELESAAWNVHANAGLNLMLLNVVGEVGYQKATDVLDVDAFQEAGLPQQAPTLEALDGGRFFASLGVRVTL